MYDVYLERAAERDLKRLPQDVLSRLAGALRGLAQNPWPPGNRKLAGSRNGYRIRIGAHRVLYEVDDQAKAVRIMRVRHRREVYR